MCQARSGRDGIGQLAQQHPPIESITLDKQHSPSGTEKLLTLTTLKK
jgi:hypothetical protein